LFSAELYYFYFSDDFKSVANLFTIFLIVYYDYDSFATPTEDIHMMLAIAK
jgi:hypothetical protein